MIFVKDLGVQCRYPVSRSAWKFDGCNRSNELVTEPVAMSKVRVLRLPRKFDNSEACGSLTWEGTKSSTTTSGWTELLLFPEHCKGCLSLPSHVVVFVPFSSPPLLLLLALL
eukprot:746260-Hanusia_phi.AAC.1